jgi:hypothetical protein
MPDQPQAESNLFREALKPGEDCLEAQDLETLLGEVAPEGLVSHVEQCSHCRTELELLRSFQANEISTGEAAAVRAIEERLHAASPGIFRRPKAEPWWKRVWLTPAWLAPAAAAILIVAGVAIQLRHNVAPPLSPVTDAGKEVFRSSAIVVVAPAGDLSQAPSEFIWEATRGAQRYQVRLLEVDRAELWKADVSDTRAAIPTEVRARIVPAKTLLWEVSAFDSEGHKVGQSETVRFRLSRNVDVR